MTLEVRLQTKFTGYRLPDLRLAVYDLRLGFASRESQT